MRDLLLALLMAGLIPVALFRPVVGVYLWAWVSMMNPHTLAFGFAKAVPWAMIIAVVTLVSVLVHKRSRHSLPMSVGMGLLLMLLLLMTVTSVFSINNPTEVWERWVFFMKTVLMLLVTLVVLRGRKQIEILLWVLVVSVGFYGVKGGIWTVLTGGGGRVWGPPGGMLAGNNELAVGLIMVLPLAYYLFLVAERRWLRWALGFSMVAMAFGILGSQSRGALLALLAIALMLGLKGKRPVRTTLALLVLSASAITFMPDSWTERMETISTYGEDRSAMSRVWTWQTLWNLALDRPLIGGGFRSDSAEVFSIYSPDQGRGSFSQDSYVAHSIYFQALGEHGFPGLILYLSFGIWIWVAAGRLGRQTKDDPEFGAWVPQLMRMCQISLLGFAVGGAFLSMMLLDLPYYLFGIVALARASVPNPQQANGFAGNAQNNRLARS